MLGGKGGGAPWWKGAVTYQIYPRSFMDSNGDGVGDLEGIRSKLGYLKEELGVDCLWLSPVMVSPDKDFGYDIADYCAIDPQYGDLASFKRLVKEAHSMGLKVLMDGVFNHTSDQHKWFKSALASPESPYRDYYIWHKGSKPPNNWASVFTRSAWTKDEASGEWYMHSFLPEQPDLNWRNAKVVEEILEVMRFWLELGVDGFRLDVFNAYFKSPGLENNPRRWDLYGLAATIAHPFSAFRPVFSMDQVPEMLKVLAKMRTLVDSFGGTLVGETCDLTGTYGNAPQYIGDDKLHQAFNFRLLESWWGARSFSNAIREWARTAEWPTWAIDNHDKFRSATRWGSWWSTSVTTARNRLVALLLLTLKGTAYIYQGQEIGMTEKWMKRSEIQDPVGHLLWPVFQGRDGCRTPMQWNALSENAGFSSGVPWLAVQGNYTEVNVQEQKEDPSSVFGAYKQLLKLRKEHFDTLALGEMTFPDTNDSRLVHFTRTSHDGETVFQIIINMTGSVVKQLEARVPTLRGGKLIYSTTPAQCEEAHLKQLAPYQGVIIHLG